MKAESKNSKSDKSQADLFWKIPGYEIQRLIGKGGMASVHLATQLSLQREVALKLLRNLEPGSSERFLNEGRTIAALKHRNIIVIHDIGTCESGHYIAMEFMEDGDLENRITQGLSQQETLHIIRQMAEALDFVHQHDIIHRDVKPANILFREDGTPVLTDFGIAKRSRIPSGLTTAGTTLGTPDYLSPEQAQEKELDGRTDLYSLGIILHEMLTGERPFRGDGYVEVILGHIQAPLPTLPAGHKRLQPLLDRLLAKSPKDRFKSAKQLMEEIDRLEAPQNQSGTITKRSQRARKSKKKGPRVLPWFALSGVFSLLVGAGFWHYLNMVDPVPMAQNIAPLETSKAPIITYIPTPEPETWEEIPEPTTTTYIAENPSLVPFSQTELSAQNPQNNTQVPPPEQIEAIEPIEAITLVEEVPNPADERLQHWLELGEARLQEYKLSTPKKDNALYYFQLVLAEDPDHQAAHQGINKIVKRYTWLAKQKRKVGNEVLAKRYIQRGLLIRPRDPTLLSLRQASSSQSSPIQPAASPQPQSPTRNNNRTTTKKTFTLSDEDIFGGEE